MGHIKVPAYVCSRGYGYAAWWAISRHASSISEPLARVLIAASRALLNRVAKRSRIGRACAKICVMVRVTDWKGVHQDLSDRVWA